MVRLGVMSDMSIKSAFPEFQAPNVALASAMDMIVLQKHELTGMRLPKDFIRKKISRFPINDIANYSTLSNVDNLSKTVYASTQGYRKKLGSSNIDREDRQQWPSTTVLRAYKEQRLEQFKDFQEKYTGITVTAITDASWQTRWNRFIEALNKSADDSIKLEIIKKFMAAQRTRVYRANKTTPIIDDNTH